MRLGVEGTLPLHSGGPSTPHTQQPDLAITDLLLFRPNRLVLPGFTPRLTCQNSLLTPIARLRIILDRISKAFYPASN